MQPDKLSDEKLKEIREGLEGVTPGPWLACEYDEDTDDHRWSVKTLATDARGVKYIPIIPTVAEMYDERLSPNRRADASHIARLDPQTVSLLLDRIDSDARRIEELQTMLAAYYPPYRVEALLARAEAAETRIRELEAQLASPPSDTRKGAIELLREVFEIAQETAEYASEHKDWEQTAYRYGDVIMAAARFLDEADALSQKGQRE